MAIDESDVPNEYTHLRVRIPGVSSSLLEQTPIIEFTMTESILTPGLQTRAIVQDPIGGMPNIRNLDEYQGQPIIIELWRPGLEKMDGWYKGPSSIKTVQHIYRIGNRKSTNRAIQTWNLEICDKSLLLDADRLCSKSWAKVNPSLVVSDVLRKCLDVDNMFIEQASPPRDYIAENIHPFQVCNQQADVALAGNDPSFLHFMTFDVGGGKHHFESFKTMAQRSPVANRAFSYSEPENPYGRFVNPFNMISYEFPCDFDNLTDILNGVRLGGFSGRSIQTFNPANGVWSNFGDDGSVCGIGGATALAYTTNSGTAAEQNSADISVEKYALLRQARMMLLEPDKVALRFTTSFNPSLKAGQTIDAMFFNRGDGTGTPTQKENYGSGKYLISSLSHIWKRDRYAITQVDCVSNSVAQGKT